MHSADKIIEKAFWALLIGVSSFGVSYLREMSNNLGLLNEKISVIVSQVSEHTAEIKEHAHRIELLETRRR